MIIQKEDLGLDKDSVVFFTLKCFAVITIELYFSINCKLLFSYSTLLIASLISEIFISYA